MLRKPTIAVIFLFTIAAHATNSQGSSIYELDISDPTCFSVRDKNEVIFINFNLFRDQQNTGEAQHNNGPKRRLKYLYSEDIGREKSKIYGEADMQTYAEIMNNKMTGYYIYTVYMKAPPSTDVVYFSKKKNKHYQLSLDQGAQKEDATGIVCDWSKSSLLKK
ncbi:hypothetical protein [Aquitalea denitrificans]|uniref:hypothetical protein n=1 Tax=Aquitalea denitrificans TaxID=519081 RepID=UPI00135C44CC|nr:hypothetical protein [Aquitalea denitrificans]